MKTRFIKTVLFLTLFLLGACNFPGLGAPSTDQEYAYTECSYVWAREPLPDLSEEFRAALTAVQPRADGHAEAYGENCLNDKGEVVRFSAMETDFYVVLKVNDLEDKAMLGDMIKQVLSVVANFPKENTPGPQSGFVGITFESSAAQLRLWFTQVDAQAALDNGLRGEELFNALQTK